ncbi:50S ribosomal protein L4 [Ostreibacterium oceani]|uniref:Large ribosomal subunit protein uL4 n=1 Tax=Ostreibacterium oceani TaxID=2654998 RepID=A0A6N7EWH3_9GAMM|nr:50S ribosomal protein L4 [Ostreibacterium oceani]MPV85769.1 50S ribosomal protein L4 [Ostreibacterium oceani]
MQVELKNINGRSGTVDLSDSVFAVDYNENLVHQIVVAYQAAGRQGTKGQKSRSDVSGGGAKPWRQKGTGRARAGTSRSPIWRKGGVTFAAVNRDYSQKVNKKMYRAAMRAIFSELLRSDRLVIADGLAVEQPKTKKFLETFQDYQGKLLLLIDEEVNVDTYLSSRNVPKVNMTDVVAIDPVSLIRHDLVVVSEAAVKKIEEWLA